MARYYSVSFKCCPDVFCANIAHAESIESVMKYYSKYSWVNIGLASESDVKTAKRKGMPIVELADPAPNPKRRGFWAKKCGKKA